MKEMNKENTNTKQVMNSKSSNHNQTQLIKRFRLT